MDAWINTGCTGELVMPHVNLAALGFPLGPTVRLGLADGSEVDLQTFRSLVDWFGGWKRIEVIGNAGQYPLLGVGLLLGRDLRIDYRTGTVTLT